MQGTEPTASAEAPSRTGRARREPVFGRLRFWEAAPLSRFAAGILLALAVVSIVVDVAGFVDDPGAYSAPEALTLLGLTAALALTAWRPPVAATAMLVVAIAAVGTGAVPESAIALAALTGFVLRSCSRGFAIAYGAAYAVWLGAVGLLPDVGLDVGAVPVLATVALASAAVGFSFRLAGRREQTLAVELVDRVRASEEAVRLERERIAGELHDIVAHDLTIIAMHARVLDRVQDDASRALSQKAIGDSAHQALVDLRRMLNALYLHDGEPDEALDATKETHPLSAVLDAVAAEFEAAGIRTRVDRPAEIRLPRSIDVTLGRIARESATNVAKHAGSTESVVITLEVASDRVMLSVANTPPRDSRRMDLPSSGYGLAGMRKRAEVFGGTFSAGPDGNGWVVIVDLPLTAP